MATEARDRIAARDRVEARRRQVEAPSTVRDDSDDEMIVSFPEFVFKEFIVAVGATVFLIIVSIWLQAPLLGKANPGMTPNPSKAPWYFLGLQELLSRFPPLMAGVACNAHAAPFQRSASTFSPLETSFAPTDSQAEPPLGQDTLFSTVIPAPLGFFGGALAHVVPFQTCATANMLPPAPVATQSAVPAQESASSSSPSPELGVCTTDQLVPFHFSVSEPLAVPAAKPTAQHRLRQRRDRPRRAVPPVGDGKTAAGRARRPARGRARAGHAAQPVGEGCPRAGHRGCSSHGCGG